LDAFVIQFRQILLTSAGVLGTVAVLLLVRQSQGYVSDYQTFPLVDWIELTFGPDDSAAFGSARRLAARAEPLLDRFSLEATPDTLPVGFTSPQFERQLAGLESTYALRLAPKGGSSEQTSGMLEVRLFRNRWRAQTYMNLSAFDLRRRSEMMEVTPRRALNGERVWLSLDDAARRWIVEADVIGQVGPVFYRAILHTEGSSSSGVSSMADRVDQTQARAEEIALEWGLDMRTLWKGE
jgi:hypothetical protein